MFCSIVIPTIGRSTLSRAIRSVLDQSFSENDFEVIIVNDSGNTLLEADWQTSKRVRILYTNKRERSVARNAGAAVAIGKYLWFLDDDDWILPSALEYFWLLAGQASDASWLYGGIRVVDESNEVLGEVNSRLNGDCFAQVLGGAWVPIQSSILRSDAFFRVGGFNPLISGTEDLDICKRIAFIGSLANTPETVACLFRGRDWNTSTDYLRAPEDVRRSRDAVLDEPGALKKIVSSARGSSNAGYWFGRAFRVYLSTISYNISHKGLFAAISRTIFGIASCLMAGRHVFSANFLNGVRADHVPETLHFITKAYEQQRGSFDPDVTKEDTLTAGT